LLALDPRPTVRVPTAPPQVTSRPSQDVTAER